MMSRQSLRYDVLVSLFPPKVKKARIALRLPSNPAKVHCDGHGLKRLLSFINHRIYTSKKRQEPCYHKIPTPKYCFSFLGGQPFLHLFGILGSSVGGAVCPLPLSLAK